MEAVKHFMESLNLYTLWKDFPIDFTHIFQKENGDCFVNTLDHILTLKRSSETIIDAGVIHLMENMSDHAPIYCVIKCNNNIAMNDPEDSKSEEHPRPR